jgi:hypothetical protein
MLYRVAVLLQRSRRPAVRQETASASAHPNTTWAIYSTVSRRSARYQREMVRVLLPTCSFRTTDTYKLGSEVLQPSVALSQGLRLERKIRIQIL